MKDKKSYSTIVLSITCLCTIIILCAMSWGYGTIQLRFEANDPIRQIQGELIIKK